MTNVKEHLELEVRMWTSLRPTAALMQRFVLRNGKFYTGMKRKGRRMTPKMCFENAFKTVLKNGGKYIEGYVLSDDLPFVIHHAWVEMPDGRINDPTLEKPENYTYMGVEFDAEKMMEETFKIGYYGILDTMKGINIDYMKRVDPELFKGINI